MGGNELTDVLKAPFPYFGGKSRIAQEVWRRFGDTPNYVEPFLGSGAVLLGRPHDPGMETVNDADGLVCVGPETRILCGDFRWRHAKTIKTGDVLISFDEHNGPPQAGIQRMSSRANFQPPSSMRKWNTTTVRGVRAVLKPSYKITFEDGTSVIASEDHLWLGGKSVAGGRGARWVSTAGLRCDTSIYRSRVMKLVDVVDQDNTADSGWIGGFYDGEGHIQGVGSGWRIVVTQKAGLEADRVTSWLALHGFEYTVAKMRKIKTHHNQVLQISIRGGMRESLRFLMLTRPERLLRTATQRLGCKSIYGRERQVVGVDSKEFVGLHPVIAIHTDSHTYIAEGFASHNCNFWRATQSDPDAVAHYADWPVNENDLHARHAWLVGRRDSLQSRLEGDPDYYDSKIAGWWCWGMCCWIGGGFCSGNGPWHVVDGELVNTSGNAGQGVNRKRVHLGNEGQGVNRKLVHLGDAGQGVNRKRANLHEWFRALSDRLRNVRVCCGDWTRVCGPSPTTKNGLTAVFLDPPYSAEAGRDNNLYRVESTTVAHDVREWALEHGDDPLMRIALCNYRESEMPSPWTLLQWKTIGGYGNQSNKQGRANCSRESIWFSPHCISPKDDLFAYDFSQEHHNMTRYGE